MTVFAHAGHWAVQLLYVAPVLFVAGVIIRERLRDRRERREEADATVVEGVHPDPGSRD